MSELAAPVTLKCTVCGGNIVNDYLAGACICAHCGNKWSMDELLPNYRDYFKAIEQITKANDILDGDPNPVAAGQAKLMFERAFNDIDDHPDAVALDLMKSCREGIEKADRISTYAKGMSFYEKKDYSQAIEEFEKVKDYRESEKLINECRRQVEANRQKHIPLAIIVGMILPAILCIFLKEKAGLPLWADIPIFLIASSGLGYLIYREGPAAIIIEVLSFVCVIPLILYLILAYVFHIDPGLATIISVAAPIVVAVVLSLLSKVMENK
ncbi:MAG: hypothetical protein J5685_03825 [Clostridiales bacterium]|nr:hypothetical protein [Clostridiales bacterium]